MIDLQEGDIVFQAEPHIYTVRGKKVPSVTQIIEAAGLGEDFFLVPPAVLKMAQSRGNAVHLACAYLDAGELDWESVDPRILGYVQAYEKFRKECLARTVQTEKKMVCMNGASPWFAGTPDWVCFLQGRRVLIDLKTCQSMPKSAALQTAGYKRLWELSRPTQPIYERYGLQLRKNATYKLHPYEDPMDEAAFIDALVFVHAKQRKEQWDTKYRQIT